MKIRHYFDHAAATPPFPEAIAAWTKAIASSYFNPSGLHSDAQKADALLQEAREACALALGALPNEVVFTATGTESDNLALRGAAWSIRRKTGRKKLVSSTIEHPAVLATLADLCDNFGFELTLLPPTRNGSMTPHTLREALGNDVALVSLIAGHNELGSLNPIAELAQLSAECGACFHTDAVQWGAWLPIDFNQTLRHVSLLSLSGRKLGSPGGGILLVRNGMAIAPQVTGGSQEFGMRAGTQDVAMAQAMAVALTTHSRCSAEIKALMLQIESELLASIPKIQLISQQQPRLPHILTCVIPGVESNALCRHLDMAGIACSPGAACKTGLPGASATLLALGFSEELARCGLRISLGYSTTQADVTALIETLPKLVAKIRERQS